jgi:hypothetical protein
MRTPAPFVVGVPRSGTTLMRLMLDAHPELAIPGETHFIPALLRSWKQMMAAGVPEPQRVREAIELITSHPRWKDLGVDRDAFEAHVLGLREPDVGELARAPFVVHAAARNKPRWGDKTPAYVTKMPRIQRAIPEATFVHVLRDGRDVAMSWAGVSWGVHDPAEAARRWVRRITVARRHVRRLRAGSYLELRYEDMVAEPEGTLRSVAEHIELPWDAAMLDYHREAKERMAPAMRELHSRYGRTITAEERERQHALVSEPPRADRVSRWREEMPEADRRAFEAIGGELLAELGYEPGTGS